MQVRLVRDVVAELTEKLNVLFGHFGAINPEPQASDILSILKKMESDLTFNQLRRLLVEYKNCEENSSPSALRAFYEFLKQRWERIDKTDLVYPLSSRTAVSQLCVILATVLSAMDSKPVYDILMPTLTSSEHVFPGQGDLSALRLHEFILGEDDSPLAVEHCFQYLENRYQTTGTHAFSGQASRLSRLRQKPHPLKKHLTLNEERMIRQHSQQACEYYDTLVLNENTARYKAAFLESLKSDHYQVTASYGAEGTSRLLDHLLANQKSPFDLSNLLVEYLPRHHWPIFMNAISRTELFRIVMGIDLPHLRQSYRNLEEFKRVQLQDADQILSKLVQFKPAFASENNLRAYLLCLLEAYDQSREEGPEFKSDAGQYIGSLFSLAFSRSDKLRASQVFRDFLLSDPPWPLADLAGYLRKNNLLDKHWGPLTTMTHFGNNTLPTLILMAMDMGRQFELKKTSTQKRTQ